MRYLVTGGCGFLGSNISAHALNLGHELLIFDNLSRVGAVENLNWLQSQGKFVFLHGDIRNSDDIDRCIKEHRPDGVFHLAGQVAMTTSIADPRKDFEINALGSLNVLEAVRQHVPYAPIIYSSTNKVYGSLDALMYQESATRYISNEYPMGFDETQVLDFHSPYGCSKGAADQYMLDYSRIFGMKTVVFRHSSIYGSRQFSTADQGWVGWFCQKALEQARNFNAAPFAISGNGKQVRDVLHAEDAVRCYFSAIELIDNVQGEVFNIGGGVSNSLSLLELFKLLEKHLDLSLRFTTGPWRESDQKIFIADTSKARELLKWEPVISAEDGIKSVLHWINPSSLNTQGRYVH